MTIPLSQATNSSLLALKECVRLQRQKEAAIAAAAARPKAVMSKAFAGGGDSSGESGRYIVPYRLSKLTRLLKPFLEGTPRETREVRDTRKAREAILNGEASGAGNLGSSLSGGGASSSSGGGEASSSGGGGSPPSSPSASAAACVIAHLSPLRSAGKHTASTLEFVGALCGVTRQAIERANYNRVELWTPEEVVQWVRELDGGKYAHLSSCFGGFTGKMLSVEWLGHVVKRVRAEGGAEEEASRIYEAFREVQEPLPQLNTRHA